MKTRNRLFCNCGWNTDENALIINRAGCCPRCGNPAPFYQGVTKFGDCNGWKIRPARWHKNGFLSGHWEAL